MRFDPLKALEDAELMPPGRYPGSLSQAEATRLCKDLLTRRGWLVDFQTIRVRYATDLMNMACLTFFWILIGALHFGGLLELYWFCLCSITIMILHEQEFFRRWVSVKATAGEITATLEGPAQETPFFDVYVSLKSQKPIRQRRWQLHISPAVRLVGLQFLVWSANLWIYPSGLQERLVGIIWCGSLGIFVCFLYRLLKLYREEQNGKIWPENRESIGFVLELARAWAMKPSSSVRLRLHFKACQNGEDQSPQSEPSGSLMASGDARGFSGMSQLWVCQPGNLPKLGISELAGTCLLISVCTDLRIPFDDQSSLNSKAFSEIGGMLEDGRSEVDPQSMIWMAQVLHQSALRWSKSL
ncbi:MAG: hypothetical protein WCJ40_16350 [Planctomycetota bacterium]